MFHTVLVNAVEKTVLEAYMPGFIIAGIIAAALILGGALVFLARLRAHLKDRHSLPQGNQRTNYAIAMERKLHMSENRED